MKRHAHILLPLTAFIAAVFVMAWPWISARFDGQETDPRRAVIVDAASASSPAQPVRLAIPSLGIDAPIVEPMGRTEDDFQRALQNGVVHFPGTALPGQPGNAYFFGHSSDYLWSPGGYKTVFVHLPKIRKGDEIEVTDASGTPFLYVVTDMKIVKPKDRSVLSQGDGSKKLLTLQTSYPIGTAFKRFIVMAELAPYARQ